MNVRLHTLAAVALATVWLAPGAWPGTLRIAPATIEEARVTVPVLVQGDVGDGVAALDFLLNFDPAVFQPVAVSAGTAATAAGKLVQGSPTNPGQYVVVMMGMNQQTVQSGEVARVVMRQISQPENNRSELSVSRTTLASLEANQIPSEGSSATVTFRDEGEDENDGGDDTENEDPSDEPDPGSDPGDGESPGEDGEPANGAPGDEGEQAGGADPAEAGPGVVPAVNPGGGGPGLNETGKTESSEAGSVIDPGSVSLSSNSSQDGGDKLDAKGAQERLARLREEAARRRAEIPDRTTGGGSPEAVPATTLAARAAERNESPSPSGEVRPLPGEAPRPGAPSETNLIALADTGPAGETLTGPAIEPEEETASISPPQGATTLMLVVIGIFTATAAVLLVARRRIVK